MKSPPIKSKHPNCRVGSNLHPWKKKIAPASGIKRVLPTVWNILKKVLKRTLGEVSALLFKVNQIWKMPDIAAGIQKRNKSRPAIEIKFMPISLIHTHWS